MKKVYFGSNLKMYKNIEDTVKYLRELTELTADISREEIELFIIPSYTTLGQKPCQTGSTEYVLGGTGTVYRRDFSSDAAGDGT